MNSRMLILVTGMPGSGKTTLSNLFKEKGYRILTMGDVIRGLAKKRRIKPTPKNLGSLAKQIRREGGKAAVAVECLKILDTLKDKRVLIDGIRSLEEVDTFREMSKVKLLAVFARQEIRYKRLIERGRRDDPAELEELDERDRRELEFGIGSAIALADYLLVNENGIDVLREKFDKISVEIN